MRTRTASWLAFGCCAWGYVAACSVAGDVPAEAALPGGLTAIGMFKVILDQGRLERRLDALTAKLDALLKGPVDAPAPAPPVRLRVRPRPRLVARRGRSAASAAPDAHREQEPERDEHVD